MTCYSTELRAVKRARREALAADPPAWLSDYAADQMRRAERDSQASRDRWYGSAEQRRVYYTKAVRRLCDLRHLLLWAARGGPAHG